MLVKLLILNFIEIAIKKRDFKISHSCRCNNFACLPLIKIDAAKSVILKFGTRSPDAIAFVICLA